MSFPESGISERPDDRHLALELLNLLTDVDDLAKFLSIVIAPK